MQTACRLTWASYADAYAGRYGARPVRNAKVSSLVKQFVQRIGQAEAPQVAAWFLNVNEAFVVRKVHDFALLLASAEAYRTQWVTGQSMTNTRAQQIDQSQANYSVADEAMQILRAKRAQREREAGGGNAQ